MDPSIALWFRVGLMLLRGYADILQDSLVYKYYIDACSLPFLAHFYSLYLIRPSFSRSRAFPHVRDLSPFFGDSFSLRMEIGF